MKIRASLALACLVAMASAMAIRLAPAPARVAAATAAYVGKVTHVTEKAVKAELFKGDVQEMKIATVKVSETILGKGAREVKVGFVLPVTPAVGRPGIIRPGIRRPIGPQLAKDMEGAFLLHKHPTMKDVYVFADFQGFINKTGNPGFDTDLKGMKEIAKLLADPMKGLKSKDAAERLKTASLLVSRYKTPVPYAEAKTEAVPPAESKIILSAIAVGEWNPKGGIRFGEPNAQMMFNQLGLTPADGWTPPMNYMEVPEAAKKWLKENAAKFKMKRCVREAAGVSEEPGAEPK